MITEKNIIDNHTHNRLCFRKCLQWTAILGGAFVGLGISFLLYVFGMAIGLSTFTATQAGVTTLAVGGFVGSAIGAIVSMFVGGWISGYLASKGYSNDYNHRFDGNHDRKVCGNIGALYGFITWVITLIVTILLATSVGTYISTRYQMASNPTATIITTTNPEAPMVSEHRPPMVGEHRMTTTEPTHMTVNDEKAVNTVGKTLFALFVLFFLGAFSSCLGGYMGIRFRCHHDVDDKRV
jgi:MFS family permease